MSRRSLNPIQYLRFFGYAVEGLHYALRHHTSFGVQILIGLMAVGAGLYFRITRVEWMVLLFVSFAVLVAELLNTAIETTLDYMEKEHHHDVKVAKDVAAGGVLLTAVGAMVVGLIIFLPYLL